ncbi:MAG: YkgJ family cysteine cluster protein [Thermodesulfobacteriota bacterium]
MNTPTTDDLTAGRALLRRPLLPLARLVGLLYLTGPFERISDVLPELPGTIETGGVAYENPAPLLQPHLPVLTEFEQLKFPTSRTWRIINEEGDELSAMEAIDLWIGHHLLMGELEAINSLLCAPCGCTLCCTGPEAAMRQDFFEIPLRPEECRRFPLARIDSEESRATPPDQEPPLHRDHSPFYQYGPALYHWQSGWSLILPRGTACPHLEESGRCRIYPDRPEVCRRPQIFSYALEALSGRPADEGITTWRARRVLLAVWDCPYVQILRDEIAAFAEACELTPLFRQNKA